MAWICDPNICQHMTTTSSETKTGLQGLRLAECPPEGRASTCWRWHRLLLLAVRPPLPQPSLGFGFVFLLQLVVLFDGILLEGLQFGLHLFELTTTAHTTAHATAP